MKNNLLQQAQEIYKHGSRHRHLKRFDGEVNLSEYLLNTFHVGEYFFFIYYLPEQKMEYVSGGVRDVLGLEEDQFSLAYLVENFHPDDLPHFLRFESTLVPFLASLPVEKLTKYKVRYDFRIKDVKGNYKRLLHQLMTLQCDTDGAVIRTFGVYTDITHLKTETDMRLNVIGMGGEPSFFDIQEDCSYATQESPLSDREIEVLSLVAEGMNSKEIAETLDISKHTVDNHRKNILEKTGADSSLAAVKEAINRMWI
jgi:DNA-binding CsgD family transcriptional regulator